MTMTCPRCRAALSAQRHVTGIAWRCEACGGQSLNFSQFRRLVPGPNVNAIWETALTDPRAPRRRALCPECLRDMTAVLIPLPQRELELDVCLACQRLWLDRQDNLAGHLTADGTAGPLPRARRRVHTGAEERLAENTARHFRRRIAANDLPNRVLWALLILYGLFWIVRQFNR